MTTRRPPQPPPQQRSHGSKGHYFLKKGGIFQKVIGVTAVAAWLREGVSVCVTLAGYERRWKTYYKKMTTRRPPTSAAATQPRQ